MPRKIKLFAPGPVNTSDSVKSALSHSDIPHRRPVFEEYFTRNQENLHKIFKADEQFTTAIISGSGTASNETALSSIIKDSNEVLVIINGVFGERLNEILTCYKYQVQPLRFTWGHPPDLQIVGEVMSQNENIEWVCMVYHETSTGMINPVREVGKLVSNNNRKFFVDCISAIGGEDVNVLRDHIDVCTGSGNKAISGPTGISFVCAKRECIPTLEKEVPRRNVYLNLQNHIEWADKFNQTPNTPAVTMFIGLDAALQELLEEGIENRIMRYQACAKIIREGIRSLNLQLLLPDELCSNTITSVFLPKGIILPDFIDEFERRGYVVYPGKGPLYEKNMFQIANMGWIHPEDCDELILILRDTINDMMAR